MMKDEGGSIEKLISLRWKRCINENEKLGGKRRQSDSEPHYKHEGFESKSERSRDESRPDPQLSSKNMDDYSSQDRERNVDRSFPNRGDRPVCTLNSINEGSGLECESSSKQDGTNNKRFFKYVMPRTKYWYQFYYRDEKEKQMAFDKIRQRAAQSKYSDDEEAALNSCEDFRNEFSESDRRSMQPVAMNLATTAAHTTHGDPSLNINADPFVPRDDAVEKSAEGTTGPVTGLRSRRGSMLSRLKRKEAATPQITNDLVSILNRMDEQRIQHSDQQQMISSGVGFEQLQPQNETDTLASAISMYKQTQASSSICPIEIKKESDLNSDPGLVKEEPSASVLTINLPPKFATCKLNASKLESVSQRIAELLITAVDGEEKPATTQSENEACGQTYQPQLMTNSSPYPSMQTLTQYQAQSAPNANLYSSVPMMNSNACPVVSVPNSDSFHSAQMHNSGPYQPPTSQYQTHTANQAQYRAQPIESNEMPPINVHVPPPTFQPVNEYQQMDQNSWNRIPPNQTVASQVQEVYGEPPPPPPPSQSCRAFGNAAMMQTTNGHMSCQTINEEESYAPGAMMPTSCETSGWHDDPTMGNWQSTLAAGCGDNSGSGMFEQVRVSSNESNSMTINVRGDSMMNIRDVQSNFSNGSNQMCFQQPPPPQMMVQADDTNSMGLQAKLQPHHPAGILKMHAPYINENYVQQN